jgi:amidase
MSEHGTTRILPMAEPIYEIARTLSPSLWVKPDETFVVETEDAFTHQISKIGDRRDKLLMPYSNPVSGPIAVEGADYGDSVRVRIDQIQPLDGYCSTYAPPHALVMAHLGAQAIDQTRICSIDERGIHWNSYLTLPYRPMIGCIATSPAMGTPTTSSAGDYGGNLDLKEITEGAILSLPVYVPSALLYVGDCHASQGDGELSACALEMRGRVTLSIGLAKGAHIPGPRIETRDRLFAVATASHIEIAIALAYSRLALWMESDYGWDRWEAYSLVTQVGMLSIGFFMAGTVAAGIETQVATRGMG